MPPIHLINQGTAITLHLLWWLLSWEHQPLKYHLFIPLNPNTTLSTEAPLTRRQAGSGFHMAPPCLHFLNGVLNFLHALLSASVSIADFRLYATRGQERLLSDLIYKTLSKILGCQLGPKTCFWWQWFGFANSHRKKPQLKRDMRGFGICCQVSARKTNSFLGKLY